ncbi:TolC family protein [Roseibium sp. SCP14]|uniref:TolC family protein n=1 Tax=Roseibium sp. SCP14 TaxID=3141375 RepID=UPI00333B6AE6
MRISQNFFFLPLLGLLAGCVSTAGELSQEERRDILDDLPQRWSQTDSAAASNIGSLMGLVSEPAVRSYVDTVLAENIQLKQSVIDLRSAEFARVSASSALWPSVDGASSAQRQRVKTGRTGDYSNSFDLSATLNWEVDLWGRLADTQSAAYSDQDAAAQDLQAARLSTAGRAMRDWIQLVTLNRLIQLDNSRISSLKRTEDIISEQFTRGLGSLGDLEGARASTESSRANLTDRKLQRDQLVRNMEVFAGQFPSSKLRASGKLPTVKLPNSGFPMVTIGRRPDLLAAYARAVAADYRTSAAYKDLLPKFAIRFTLSDQASDLSDLLQGGPAWSLLGNLTAPLFDAGARKATAKEQDLAAARAWLDYRDALLTTVLEVENALNAEFSLRKRQAQLARAYEHAQENYQQFERRYRDGLTDIVTLLTAERAAFDAHQALFQVQQEWLQNRINLALALGIGL